jgi:hypothetical protein
MHVYRFAFYDSAERLVGEELESFATDAAAIRHARILLSRHITIVVWRGDHLVDRVSA